MTKNNTEYIFLFDLDSTITKKEILPTISQEYRIFENFKDKLQYKEIFYE